MGVLVGKCLCGLYNMPLCEAIRGPRAFFGLWKMGRAVLDHRWGFLYDGA